MNNRICVAIPSRNELYLTRTVKQFFASAKAPDDVEIWVVLDGWDKTPDRMGQAVFDQYRQQQDEIKAMADADSRIHIIEHDIPQGVRVAANKPAALTEARYFMKIDAHTELSPNWDYELRTAYDYAGYESLIIPRICSMDPEHNFEHGTRWFDHCYIDPNIHQKLWADYKTRPEAQANLSECMSNLGATWFCSTQYWWQLGGHDESLYMWGESGPETSLKCWLSGGKQYLIKSASFAHVFRRRFPYSLHGGKIKDNKEVTKKYWLNNEYPLQIHPVEWLVGRFWPVPEWEDTTCNRPA